MALEFRLPDIGEGLAEAEIVRWLVDIGDPVELDAPMVEVETDKAVVEIPAPQAGVLIYQGGDPGDVIAVGEILAVIGAAGETWAEEEPAEEPPIVGTLSGEAELLDGPTSASASVGAVKALPVVRKLARQRGVDLAGVTGSGPDGRITRDDVLAVADSEEQAPSSEERVRLTRTRRTIAEHLTKSWSEIPHVTTFDDVDGGPLLTIRSELMKRSEQSLPLEALFIKALLPALERFPEFNATLEGDELVLKRHYDIGVAVDTPPGLIVPVVKGADSRSLLELASEITRLTEAAQSRTVTPAELSGSTFTVSNIGAVGGGHGTPIIPWGTTAILSIGKAREKPVVRGGEVTVATMIPLSLSYDHRVIDGGTGRRFIAMLVEHLEEPDKFLA